LSRSKIIYLALPKNKTKAKYAITGLQPPSTAVVRKIYEKGGQNAIATPSRLIQGIIHVPNAGRKKGKASGEHKTLCQ
jgi:hypothetical protein